MISARAVGSSADVGSSSTINSGSVTMARAMPTRCCWPALSSAGNCSSVESRSPTRRDTSRTRWRWSWRETPMERSGSAMVLPIRT